MDESELDIGKWAAPFYLEFLHGNFVGPKSHFGAPPHFELTQSEWLLLVRESLARITPEVVGDLLSDHNWRTRICGAYFCGLKRWHEFTVPLGQALVRNDFGLCAQGYCFALARFSSHAGANYLAGYLHQAARGDERFSESDWALAALRWTDGKMNTRHADEPFERLVPLLQKRARLSAEMVYREMPGWWQMTQDHMGTSDCSNLQTPLASSADELQVKLREQEKNLYSVEVPEPDLQPEWFWKLMGFCQTHFDTP